MTIADFQKGDGTFTDQDLVALDTEYEYEISKSKTNNQVALSLFVGSRTGNNNGNLGTGGLISFYGYINGYWHNIKLDLDFEKDFPTKTIKNSSISKYKIKIKKGTDADFIITVKPSQKLSDS
jgi:hypothetical protein